MDIHRVSWICDEYTLGRDRPRSTVAGRGIGRASRYCFATLVRLRSWPYVSRPPEVEVRPRPRSVVPAGRSWRRQVLFGRDERCPRCSVFLPRGSKKYGCLALCFAECRTSSRRLCPSSRRRSNAGRSSQIRSDRTFSGGQGMRPLAMVPKGRGSVPLHFQPSRWLPVSAPSVWPYSASRKCGGSSSILVQTSANQLAVTFVRFNPFALPDRNLKLHPDIRAGVSPRGPDPKSSTQSLATGLVSPMISRAHALFLASDASSYCNARLLPWMEFGVHVAPRRPPPRSLVSTSSHGGPMPAGVGTRTADVRGRRRLKSFARSRRTPLVRERRLAAARHVFCGVPKRPHGTWPGCRGHLGAPRRISSSTFRIGNPYRSHAVHGNSLRRRSFDARWRASPSMPALVAEYRFACEAQALSDGNHTMLPKRRVFTSRTSLSWNPRQCAPRLRLPSSSRSAKSPPRSGFSRIARRNARLVVGRPSARCRRRTARG